MTTKREIQEREFHHYLDCCEDDAERLRIERRLGIFVSSDEECSVRISEVLGDLDPEVRRYQCVQDLLDLGYTTLTREGVQYYAYKGESQIPIAKLEYDFAHYLLEG